MYLGLHTGEKGSFQPFFIKVDLIFYIYRCLFTIAAGAVLTQYVRCESQGNTARDSTLISFNRNRGHAYKHVKFSPGGLKDEDTSKSKFFSD